MQPHIEDTHCPKCNQANVRFLGLESGAITPGDTVVCPSCEQAGTVALAEGIPYVKWKEGTV